MNKKSKEHTTDGWRRPANKIFLRKTDVVFVFDRGASDCHAVSAPNEIIWLINSCDEKNTYK